MPESNNIPLTHLGEIIANEPDKAQSMAVIDFYMEALKDPEDALVKAEAPDYIFAAYAEKRMRAFAQMISEQTGADPEQIINPETRTEEQQKLLVELSGRSMMQRFQAYLKSNFASAKILLMDIAKEAGEGIYLPIYDTTATPEDMQGLLDVPHMAALYFFALHPEIDPQGQDGFKNDENKKELFGIFARMDEFYRGNRDFLQNEQTFATAFIKADNPENADKVIKVVTRKIDSLDYPIDKVNSSIWSLLNTPPEDGQIALHTEKRGSKNPVLTLYSIDFSKVEELIEASGGKITRKLSQYDKRVCTAAASLYNSGQDVFSFTRLYEAMGNIGRPGKNDFAKLEAAIKKLEGAIIMLDNKAEIEAGYKYPSFKYYGSVMPLEFVKAEIDGVTVEAAIHLFREPPVISFARQRKQFTTVTLKMLQSPVNKNENSLAIEDYLIEYIARAKDERESIKKALSGLQRKKAENRTEQEIQRIDELKKELEKPIRIKLATIFEKAHIPAGGTQARAREATIPKLLKHYKDNGFISDFTSDKNGYSITA